MNKYNFNQISYHHHQYCLFNIPEFKKKKNCFIRTLKK